MVAKISVALGGAELAWAKARARRERKSLSAVVTEALANERPLEALGEVVAWMSVRQPPLTATERKRPRHALRSRAR